MNTTKIISINPAMKALALQVVSDDISRKTCEPMKITIDSKTVLYITGDGTVYKVRDTEKPYVAGEYPAGGYHVSRHNPKYDQWEYSDNSPDEHTLANYMQALARRHKG